MRRITAALLLTSCLLAGEAALAQEQNPAAETRQASMQSPSKDGASDMKSKQNRKDNGPNKKEEKKAQAAQSNCAPNPNTPGEGDPDAPQNHVEYGGGG